MFTLAHLSDPHLAPLPTPSLAELANKRFLGYLNWLRSRKAIHARPILDAIVEDMLARAPDHIAVGGDLTNLALPDEFRNSLAWLESLGGPERVSAVPGNHDAYIRADWKSSAGLWAAYMVSHAGCKEKRTAGADGFPYVRHFGRVSLIALNSGIPTPPFFASGRLEGGQLAALGRILAELGEKKHFRIVLIHHPPLPGLAPWLRALRGAAELRELLTARGAELVLYGHNHSQAVTMLAGATGSIPVIGAPSASSSHGGADHLARYNLFAIRHEANRWRCEMTGRGLRTPGGPVTELEQRRITG